MKSTTNTAPGKTDAFRKALTIHQPYAHAIVQGSKDIENRTWRPVRGGRIMIHAGKTKPNAQVMEWVAKMDEDLDLSELPLMAIVGSVEVAGYVTREGVTAFGDRSVRSLMHYRRSAWYTGDIGWILVDPIAYDVPVVCRGQYGLWHPSGEDRAKCLVQEIRTPCRAS